MAVVISPSPAIQFLDQNSRLLVGGKLFIYLSGTSTKALTYSDYTGTTPNTNPIILNNLGQSPGIFLGMSEALKYVMAPANDTDPPTNPLWTIDGVDVPLTSANVGTIAIQDANNVNITGGTVSGSTLTATDMATVGDLTVTGQTNNSDIQVGTLLNSPAPGNAAFWLTTTIVNADGTSAEFVTPYWSKDGTLWDDNGILAIDNFSANYPASPLGLGSGAVWSNGGTVSVIPGVVPNPGAPPVYFGFITADQLRSLGGGNLPTFNPLRLGQLWNNNGSISIVETNVTVLLANDGGVLVVSPSAGYPSSATGLVAGSLWRNTSGGGGGVVSVVPGVTPNPFAPPVFFSSITAAILLTLGGGNLPLTNPGAGSGQLWNNGGVVSIA